MGALMGISSESNSKSSLRCIFPNPSHRAAISRGLDDDGRPAISEHMRSLRWEGTYRMATVPSTE